MRSAAVVDGARRGRALVALAGAVLLVVVWVLVIAAREPGDAPGSVVYIGRPASRSAAHHHVEGRPRVVPGWPHPASSR